MPGSNKGFFGSPCFVLYEIWKNDIIHDTRHTHASLMLKQRVNPKVVQERLGHASIQMTIDTYSHVALVIQEAAVNRFDGIITGNPIHLMTFSPTQASGYHNNLSWSL